MKIRKAPRVALCQPDDLYGYPNPIEDSRVEYDEEESAELSRWLEHQKYISRNDFWKHYRTVN